jgi:spore germination protein KC
LIRFFRITEADGDLFLSVFGSTQRKRNVANSLLAGEMDTKGKTNETQILGSAVFKEGRMIGTLDGEETRMAQLLNDYSGNSSYYTTIPDMVDPKYKMTMKIAKTKHNKTKFNPKKLSLSVAVPLQIEVLTDHSMINYAKNPKKREELKSYLNARITQRLNQLVKKSQNEFKGEPFGWSLIARKSFLTVPQYEAFDWMKTYPKIKVEVTTTIKFGEFGRQSELPSIEKVRD